MLTLPLATAALSAGLIGGIHCAGMCGGIASMLTPASSRKVITISTEGQGAKSVAHAWQLHAGRLFSYAVMGGVVGALGGASLMLKPIAPVHMVLFLVGNLALIWLGLRLVGAVPHFAFFSGVSVGLARALQGPRRHPFMSGMAWGLLPCGLLYGVLPFALLSGDALSGAILMLLFGLAALPYLLLAQWAALRRQASSAWKFTRCVGAAVLIGIGIFGLLHVNSAALPSLFCVTPLG